MEINSNNILHQKKYNSDNAILDNFSNNLANDLGNSNNKLREEYLINLEGLIKENENYKQIIEKIKNENFRLNNEITKNSVEKQDFINQMKKQQEKEEILNHKINEHINSMKIFKQKEDNYAKLSNEFFQKETERINFINQQNKQIENLKDQIENLKISLKEKENQILLKANEVNDLYQIKSDYESKIISYSNEIQREKDNNRELVLKLEIMNSEFNLKLQLDYNQINHLNENINQLNDEIKLNKENAMFQIHKFENRLSEIQLERDLLKSQNELLNSQIISFKKTIQIKEAETEEKNNQIENLNKTIKQLNNQLQICSETITERDFEISKIYKYKENFDKYTYIEKNFDIFSIINAADLATLQNEFRKLYALNRENKVKLESLSSINEQLRSDSQQFTIIKEKFSEIESLLNSTKKELVSIKLENCEIKKLIEELKTENILLKELKNRVSEQNKKLLLDMKLSQSSFNLLNASVDRNKKDYEKFLYNNIEDLESKNSDLHYNNIKLTNQLENEIAEKHRSLEAMKEKDLLIKEQKEYIENLENNLHEINSKVNSFSYYNQIGLKSSFNNVDSYQLHSREDIAVMNTKLRENHILIDEYKSKINLYEKQINDFNERIYKYNEESLNLKNEKHSLVGEVNYYKNQFNSLNLKISNLENQILLKDNYINATNYENLELKKNLDNLRKQKETIFEEISNNSKEAINKLNENKQIFLEQIEKLSQENNLLKNNLKEFNQSLLSAFPKEDLNINKDSLINKEGQDKIKEEGNMLDNTLMKNFGGLHNLLSLVDNYDRETLFSLNFNENFKENKDIIDKKFQVLKKILQLADRSINDNLDNKLKFENLNSIIYNQNFKCELYQKRIAHLEIMIKNLSGNNELEKVKSNFEEKNFMEIDFMPNKETSIKKPKEPHMKIINSSIISSSDLYKTLKGESKKIINNIKDEDNIFKISFVENNEFIKKYLEALRQNDSYRIVNMELNSKIIEIKNQNEELFNKRFDSGVTSSNTSKFFFEKYNELLVEKVNLEGQTALDKTEMERLHNEIINLNKEISNLKIEKKDMEKMFGALEKKYNEEGENKIKLQENLMTQIEDLKTNNQSFQKEKANFNNVFNKIRNDKINLENINKNNSTEITTLKEKILQKEEMITTLRIEIENLNKKINENNQQKIELEAKVKSSSEAKNNIWVKKLIAILYRSKGIIEMFIQLKNSFEEKIKNYENAMNLVSQTSHINGVLRQSENLIGNNLFVNGLSEINNKMQKYENELKQSKKREEILEKKIVQLNNEISLLEEKEKIIGNDYKALRERINIDAKNLQNSIVEGSQPKTGPGQEIKIYFSKLVQHITTARNIINFKDGIIKRLEGEVSESNTKLTEEKNSLNNISISGCSKCNLYIAQNKKLLEINSNLSKNLQDETKEKYDIVNKNRNTLIENISLTKDINGIIKFLNCEFNEKSDQPINNINLTHDQSKKSSELKDHNYSNINNTETSNNSNINLERTRKDFSSLLILMRKATRLINVFDNKVKLVAKKLQP